MRLKINANHQTIKPSNPSTFFPAQYLFPQPKARLPGAGAARLTRQFHTNDFFTCESFCSFSRQDKFVQSFCLILKKRINKIEQDEKILIAGIGSATHRLSITAG
jgi:hypothetical protein